MGTTPSMHEYMVAEQEQAKAKKASEESKNAKLDIETTKTKNLIQQEAYRDAGMLTQHLPSVNPRTKFTVAQYTGIISPVTRGQTHDVRGLPKSIINNPIKEVPGFLQQADRSEAYLDQREIAMLQGKRQIEFV